MTAASLGSSVGRWTLDVERWTFCLFLFSLRTRMAALLEDKKRPTSN